MPLDKVAEASHGKKTEGCGGILANLDKVAEASHAKVTEGCGRILCCWIK